MGPLIYMISHLGLLVYMITLSLGPPIHITYLSFGPLDQITSIFMLVGPSFNITTSNTSTSLGFWVYTWKHQSMGPLISIGNNLSMGPPMSIRIIIWWAHDPPTCLRHDKLSLGWHVWDKVLSLHYVPIGLLYDNTSIGPTHPANISDLGPPIHITYLSFGPLN